MPLVDDQDIIYQSAAGLTDIENNIDVSYEICPAYPRNLRIPKQWNSLTGAYRLAELLPGIRIGETRNSSVQVTIEEGILKMYGAYGPIIPVDDRYLRIIGGPFEGETMEYCTETGQIIHQKTIFIPNKNTTHPAQ